MTKPMTKILFNFLEKKKENHSSSYKMRTKVKIQQSLECLLFTLALKCFQFAFMLLIG